MFKRALIFFMVIIACFLVGCQDNVSIEIPDVSGTFEFTVLKAGQADAIYIKTENHNIILDCGEKDDGDKLVELLQENGVTNADYLFITHFDKDHVGGFPEVMDNITATNIIVPNYTGNNKEYEKYVETVNKKNLNITSLAEDTTLIIDDVLFEISVPKKQIYAEGDNDFSLVISVTHGKNSFLFAADAEKGRLPEVISEFGTQYDFLKVPHHGKHNKQTKRFVNIVKPTYAVICDSEKNPAEVKTIAALETVGSKIFSTKDGDIFVSSDGKEIKISQ